MPKYFDKFVDLVYIVYYSDERVHKRIGWRSGPLQPLGWEMPAWDPSVFGDGCEACAFLAEGLRSLF